MSEAEQGWVDATAMLACGVYALVWRGKVVYVGKSKCMLQRVYAHRSARGRRAAPWLPRGVTFDAVWVQPVHPDRVDAVERELIGRLRPRYNVALKPPLIPPDLANLIGLNCAASPPPNFTRRV